MTLNKIGRNVFINISVDGLSSAGGNIPVPPAPEKPGTAFHAVGEIIIAPESMEVLYDEKGNPTADLLWADGSSFNSGKYPQLLSKLGSNTLLNISDAIGSPFPYKYVADYTGN